MRDEEEIDEDEEDDDEEEQATEEDRQGVARGKTADGKLRPVDKNYITPAGYKKLVEEREFLHFKKRPEVVRFLADAAAEGDRSENAEYIYRKRQLREIDRRLRFLGKRVDKAVIVDPQAQTRRDRVFFGATVTLDDEDGNRHVYRIVGADEIDAASGMISWRSPIGHSLLGKEVGDTVTVKLQAGTREITVVAISYGA